MKKSTMPAAGMKKAASGSKVMAPGKSGYGSKTAGGKSMSGSKGSKKGC